MIISGLKSFQFDPTFDPTLTLTRDKLFSRSAKTTPLKGRTNTPKPPFHPLIRRTDPHNQPPHLNPRKNPQNRPFTAIPRAKYNLGKPRLNFCYRKRARGPSKIKPKYNFRYSLFCFSLPANLGINHCFSGNFRAKFCQTMLYGLFWGP